MADGSSPYQTVLVDCLAVGASDEVVVVTDSERREIAEHLVDEARTLRAESVLIDMSVRASSAAEPPRAVASAMLNCDVVIAPTTRSLSHTAARKAASDAGVRVATMPGITADMLERTMSADYAAIKGRSEAVAQVLTEARRVHVSSDEGTDVTFDLTGRSALADTGDLRHPGAFGNLPAGEGFIAPLEGATEGRIVFDGAVPLYSEPLVVKIVGGFAVDLEGEAGRRFREEIEPRGRDAFAVAELGIGTNEAARLTGEVLEDEKILGSIHVAFGDNHSFGGKVRVASHVDQVVLRPTVVVDGTTLLSAGELLV